MSQETKILSYLKSDHSLTPIQALQKFGCFRLSGRIFSLKKRGHKIKTEIVQRLNKRFASYKLIK